MPLSEYEQRVLEELERDLGTDPKLTSAMTRAHRSGGRVLGAALGVLAGLGIVLAGVMYQIPLLGVAGFAVMAFSALWTLSGGAKASGPGAKKGAPAARKKRQGFMSRLEDRFERRREQGDL